MNAFLFLLDVSTTVDASQAATTGEGGFNIFGLSLSNPITAVIVYVVVIFAFMYILAIRPQKKREGVVEDMQKNVQIGDSVLLSTGLYGKVVDITAECFIVEFGLNKGVRVPVLKEAVINVKDPNLSNKEVVIEEPEKKGFFGKLFK